MKINYNCRFFTGFTPSEVAYIKDTLDKMKPDEELGYEFDYPEYGGLKKSISSRLSSDQVDAIQHRLDYGKIETVDDMVRVLVTYGCYS